MNVPGECLGSKAIEQATETLLRETTSRQGAFDVPGEGTVPGARDLGRGEADRPGSSFDGPWDRQVKPVEQQVEHLVGNEVPDLETRPPAEAVTCDHIQEAVQGRDIGSLVKDYNIEVARTSAGGEYREVESVNLRPRSPEQVTEARSEFNQTRNELIGKWEEENQRSWPTYGQDVTSPGGKTIRLAGDRYDAHHVQPLELGGKNTADNITPMHANDHFDKQGIHRPGGAYDNMVRAAKEA